MIACVRACGDNAATDAEKSGEETRAQIKLFSGRNPDEFWRKPPPPPPPGDGKYENI